MRNHDPKAAQDATELFLNRELSWLEFNQRVLDQALAPQTPLLERLKFFCIVGSNLDEFFEVRVAGLKQRIESGGTVRDEEGTLPSTLFRAIERRIRRLVRSQYSCWRNDLAPALASEGITFPQIADLSTRELGWLQTFYRAEVRQVLTPLSIDPSHPFPLLINKSLNLIVQLERENSLGATTHTAIVPVPRQLPRLIQLPGTGGPRAFMFLGRLVGHFLGDLFPGMRILGFWLFRVTRNSELYIDEEEVANLLQAVENELHNRRRGDAVRLEVARDCPESVRQFLLTHLRLKREDLYIIDGPLNPARLMSLCDREDLPHLKDPPFTPQVAQVMRSHVSVFDVIRAGDVLLHHPYESFASVVDFLTQAAEDPRVLAIKQTLYRTGGDERIVGALMRAVRNGKQVTAVVELRARFDEANNVEWAKRLEEAGVLVVYGLVGFKIHSKVTLVVRRDEDGIRRYVHLGTGNYNPTTARAYTDLSLFTCNPDFGEDATNLFNLLTGICQYQPMRQLIVAPFALHQRMTELIEREAAHARRGLATRIVAKMNSLVDPRIIESLYSASQAGVRIDLIVRGTCCLRPGVPGLSENIQVRSIVDRFLEHSRVFYFENACQPEVFVGSADWMPRNFFRRIEVVFPIHDGRLRDRLVHEVLELALKDNVKARMLKPNGLYLKPLAKRGAKRIRSQEEFIRRTIAAAERVTANTEAGNGASLIRVKLAPNPFRRGAGPVPRLPSSG